MVAPHFGPSDTPPETLPTLLQDAAEEHGERPLLHFENSSWSFKEVNRYANGIAQSLLDCGLRPGDNVATLLGNSPEHICVWFAASKIGCVYVPINVNLGRHGLNHILQDSTPHSIIIESETVAGYESAVDQDEGPEFEFLIGDSSPDYHTFESLWETSNRVPDNDLGKSDAASIIYTSGTTGLPKGVVLPHFSYINTGTVSVQRYQLGPDDRMFTSLPLFHCNTQQTAVLPALLTGNSVAIAEWFSVSDFWDQIRTFGATHFKFIGTMLTALEKQPERSSDSKNPARLGIGAPVPETLFEEFEERFDVQLVEGYGLTETATTAAQNPIDKRKKGSFGTPHEHISMDIVNDNDESLPPNEVGEIVIRPTKPYTIMLEYHNCPEETVRSWENLWLHTGDLGFVDEDGYFFFVDRKSHSIRRRGENVSSSEVEQVLRKHPAVDECAVVGVPSELGEEDVKAYIKLHDGETENPAEIIEWLDGRIGYFKIPRYIEFVSSFSKTSTERIKKSDLEVVELVEVWDRTEAGMDLSR
jgi:acyl-CoA synthetase (AMP-forming)/AMP-acid ligase II